MVVSLWIPYNSTAEEYVKASTSIKSSVLLRSNFIMVVSLWIPYNSAAEEYIKASTSIKSSVLLRSNFESLIESHNESPHKERDVYEIPTAAGYSSADLSAGIVSHNITTSDQAGLTVDTYPIGVAVNPITKKTYTTNELSNSLSVISSTSNNVEGTISLGNFPYGVGVNPFDSRVYVTNRGSNTVSVIDGSTNTKLHNITVQDSPLGIAVNPSANWIYVTWIHVNSDIVSVIDGITNKVTYLERFGDMTKPILV